MPLCLEPGATFDVVLKSDQDKPAPVPTFRFTFLSVRDVLAETDNINEVEKKHGTGSREVVTAVGAAIRRNLVGWNLPGFPYDPVNLLDILTVSELWELYYAAQNGRRLDAASKNASGSPLNGKAAAPAPAARAGTVKTPSPRTPPPSSSVPPARASGAPNAPESAK